VLYLYLGVINLICGHLALLFLEELYDEVGDIVDLVDEVDVHLHVVEGQVVLELLY
jgi:hypothetical protein